MPETPAWFYDEMRQTGIDFTDPAEVERYDDRQGVMDEEYRKILDELLVRRGTALTEIGTGTGWLAIAAARRGAHVDAADISETMLAQARKNAARAHAGDIRFHHAGFLTFEPMAPGDVVVSSFALHHLSDFWKQAALLRVFKMLRPGGQLFVRDVVFSFAPANTEYAVERWIDEMMAQGSGWSREDFETHVREEHSTYSWVMRGLLERAGFKVRERCWAPTYADYFCHRPE